MSENRKGEERILNRIWDEMEETSRDRKEERKREGEIRDEDRWLLKDGINVSASLSFSYFLLSHSVSVSFFSLFLEIRRERKWKESGFSTREKERNEVWVRVTGNGNTTRMLEGKKKGIKKKEREKEGNKGKKREKEGKCIENGRSKCRLCRRWHSLYLLLIFLFFSLPSFQTYKLDIQIQT